MNDPQIAVYFALVNPKNTVQYGGATVGPIIKEALTSCFSILNIPKQNGGIPLDARYWVDKKTYKVDNYIGLHKNEITLSIISPYFLSLITFQLNGLSSTVSVFSSTEGTGLLCGFTLISLNVFSSFLS